MAEESGNISFEVVDRVKKTLGFGYLFETALLDVGYSPKSFYTLEQISELSSGALIKARTESEISPTSYTIADHALHWMNYAS